VPHLRLSFDLRRPDFVTACAADLAAAMLDICQWADGLGFDLAYFAEHHSAEDGYLPSPLIASAAAAGRTSRMRLRPILLAPLYHPLRLAEDIAVADLLSGGRLSPVFAAGYRRAEFDMFDVGLHERRRRVKEAVEVCRLAWRGEPFNFRGRTVTVTPTPAQRPGVPIIMGGAVEAAARRAAHLADGFDPAEPRAWEFYRDECLKLGRDPGPCAPRGPSFLYVTHDPEAVWAEIGPNLLHGAKTYARWLAESELGSNEWYPPIGSVDELRAGGAYQIVTPEECIAIACELGATGHLILHPLFGGTEPKHAWASLRLFETEVLPYIEVAEHETIHFPL
jgi:alkanesulfonate monooxygenase SsuD/methylene tetrahydromethanopterin reductase-like flavin-dependent oxidoreductase (luciferase family)